MSISVPAHGSLRRSLMIAHDTVYCRKEQESISRSVVCGEGQSIAADPCLELFEEGASVLSIISTLTYVLVCVCACARIYCIK
jgi:hypothetical protein